MTLASSEINNLRLNSRAFLTMNVATISSFILGQWNFIIYFIQILKIHSSLERRLWSYGRKGEKKGGEKGKGERRTGNQGRDDTWSEVSFLSCEGGRETFISYFITM